MSSQNDETAAQTLPDRTQNPAEDKGAEGEISKNAAKKAAKAAKQAADKAEKAANKGIGNSEAKKPTSKAPKKKIEGAALIGIDVSKEEDFPSWYQQVLTKGDMLDYYDVSGCFILKVISTRTVNLLLYLDTDTFSLRRISSGRLSRTGSMSKSRRWESRTALFLCSYRRMFCRERRITLKASLQKSHG
jgi:hypothetical protein